MPYFTLIIICFILRMIPIIVSTVIAAKKERSEMLWAFLGLLFGWIAVLIVACLSNAHSKSASNAEELFKLKKLLDENIISQEEFEKAKRRTLGK